MINRDSDDRIVISCDSPSCDAKVETNRRTIPAASDAARDQGWAVGNDLDACPSHHSGGVTPRAERRPRRGPVSAPFEAQFKLGGESEMFAHNLEEMVGHVAAVVKGRDKRFRGYLRVTNHDRTLTFLELNVLGTISS